MPATGTYAPSYRFEPVAHCDMCGADPLYFRVYGHAPEPHPGFETAPAAGIAVSVKKCGNCELVFADPQPIPDRFDAHYGAPEDYWTAEQIEGDNDLSRRRLQMRSACWVFVTGCGRSTSERVSAGP